jgi:hypothetical protein
MKKTFVLAALTASSLLLSLAGAGCGLIRRDSPSKAAKLFCVAVGKGDTETYSRLSTRETADVITLFKDEFKKGVASKKGIAKATETISGNQAVVVMTFKDGTTDKLGLVKVGGKWKVTMSQELSWLLPTSIMTEGPSEPGESEPPQGKSDKEGQAPPAESSGEASGEKNEEGDGKKPDEGASQPNEEADGQKNEEGDSKNKDE